MVDVTLYLAMFSTSVISGMLGIGVAFAAIPILGMTNMTLVNEIQPVALFLNGVTALFSAVSFARAGHVDWSRALLLATVASICSPLGAMAAQMTGEATLWSLYFLVVPVVVGLLLWNRPVAREILSFRQVLWLSAPISSLSGLLGVGPGFLIVPLMIFAGFGARRAAAINAVAVTPASFVSLVPHLKHATVDAVIALPIVMSAIVGAFLGGYLSSRHIPEIALRRLFIFVIVTLSIYKAIILFNTYSWNFVD